MKESNRQKKFGKVILKEMSEMFQREISIPDSPMMTVTVVRVTADLGIARVYISVFPDDKGEATIEHIVKTKSEIRWKLASRIKKQVRHVPDLQFYLDDTQQEVSYMDDLFDRIIPKDESASS